VKKDKRGIEELMIVKDILKVIYSPVKAFESIAKKPDIKGPFIILALILVSATIEQTVLSSKILLANRMPENDQWTESISLWSSNGLIALDNSAYVTGNYSVESTVTNGTKIWMRISNIGTINCTEDDSYKQISFWTYWSHQSNATPINSTLKLFSTNESRYFELNLNESISKSSGDWSTPLPAVVVGQNNPDWNSISSPSWENITGIEFKLEWSSQNAANLTMRIDDLCFVGKPVSFLSTSFLGNYIVFSLFNTVIGFFLTWMVYIMSFFVISGIIHQKMGSWRMLIIATGYSFAIAIVGVLVRAMLYLSLPAVSFPLSSWPPSSSDDIGRVNMLEANFWGTHIAYPLSLVTNLVLDIWIIALCAVALRALGELSWKKAVIFAAIAYLIKIFLFPIGSMV
jgi:hypothetical protein